MCLFLRRKRSDMSEYRFCELFFPSALIISGNENGGPRARESLYLKKNRLNVTYKNHMNNIRLNHRSSSWGNFGLIGRWCYGRQDFKNINQRSACLSHLLIKNYRKSYSKKELVLKIDSWWNIYMMPSFWHMHSTFNQSVTGRCLTRLHNYY